ncbi:peptidoglycan-binding domain-containing protein, partial [Streptomyces beijiangensis]|nr:hypothetical protein [Streptomyces beijiangensis]
MRHPFSRLGLSLALVVPALLGSLGPASLAPGRAPRCTADTGPYQREVERGLRLTADGRQSPADCAAVRRFQQGHRVRPANGYAGLATYRIMLVVQAGTTPNRAGRCPSSAYRTVCVDLGRQLLWVQRGRRIVYAPVPVRTGSPARPGRCGPAPA